MIFRATDHRQAERLPCRHKRAGRGTVFSAGKQLAEKESVTEALKAENQMLWAQKMNNILNAAMEIVSSNLICA